jgi:hypothetical protein
MLTVYLFDNDGYYAGESLGQENPLVPGNVIMPPNSTEIPPPTGENIIGEWNGEEEEWASRPDFSGVKYYNKTTKAIKYFEKGEAFDDDYTSIAPPYINYYLIDYVVWNGTAWVDDPTLKEDFDKEICKQTAISIIKETEWITNDEFDMKIANRTAFLTYRLAIFNFIQNPVANPTFPTQPEIIFA